MEFFTPSPLITACFAALTLAVVVADLWLVALAHDRNHPGARTRWLAGGALFAAVWLAGHATIAESGILIGDGFPPPVMPYLAFLMIAAIAVAFSPIGRAVSSLPLTILVGLQIFRLPLEMILHHLYSTGNLPVQMTWSGYNMDVFTAILAIVVVVLLRRGASDRIVWAWNAVGTILLINVVAIAVLSSPVPFRQFTNDPPVVLVLFAPFNWIASVHVFTAVVGHAVIFRALRARNAA